jgi:hypothetical protein
VRQVAQRENAGLREGHTDLLTRGAFSANRSRGRSGGPLMAWIDVRAPALRPARHLSPMPLRPRSCGAGGGRRARGSQDTTRLAAIARASDPAN